MTTRQNMDWRTEIARLAARDSEVYQSCQIGFCADWVRHCESPIEEIFAAHIVNWACWAEYSGAFAKVTLCDTPELIGKRGTVALPADRCVCVAAQQPISTYRADFLIVGRAGANAAKIVIECDGHDFHEKTKEQARRDRSRDRAMTLRGFKVLRFTGSEIVADPGQCFHDVTTLLHSELGTAPCNNVPIQQAAE